MGRKAGIDMKFARRLHGIDATIDASILSRWIHHWRGSSATTNLKGQLPQEAIHLQMDRLLTQAIGTLERWVTPYLQPTTPLSDLDEAFEQMDGLPQLSRSRRRVVSLPRVSSLPSTEIRGVLQALHG